MTDAETAFEFALKWPSDVSVAFEPKEYKFVLPVGMYTVTEDGELEVEE